MRLLSKLVACAVFGLVVAVPAAGGPAGAGKSALRTYVVVYNESASLAEARAAVRAIGGSIVKENASIGVATVRSAARSFITEADAQRALDGAAQDRPIGYSKPELREKADELRLDSQLAKARASRGDGGHGTSKRGEPLAHLQWDMEMIDATPKGSYGEQRGKRRVLVGIIDTGIDGSHPDLEPNFSSHLSRNFTTDIPLVDGPCEDEPDGSCSDPADVDENGHGTHVSGTVAAAQNGLGISGIAPRVTLVNLRAGQDSGYFFLQESVDALTYAGDSGIDVVNMSYYIDPWQYNCADNPADSPEEQLEQQTIIEATNRALDYAHERGVTLIGAAGNANTDLGNPTFDDTSPDFPPGSERERTIDNSCLDMPTEGNNVISVSALGPTKVKADYSNYGVEQTVVSAPGGFFRDFLGTPQNRTPETLVLSTYPENVAREFGEIDENGEPTTPFVLRDCNGKTCAYYTYFQGTSMAAPHATGVAALIVSEHGLRRDGGYGLNPHTVQRILERSAVDHACPEPRLFDYGPYDRPDSFDAFCDGTPEFNGFYGHGIVNALNAVEDDDEDEDEDGDD